MKSARPNIDRRHLLRGAVAGAASLSVSAPAFARAIETPATAEDETFMRLALVEALRGDRPFGAVIVREGKAVALGRNLVVKHADPTAHAEMVAIRRFLSKRSPDQIKEATIYASGEPSPMGMGAILWCRIPRLVYGASIAELATKTEQILVTSKELAEKAGFAEIKITGGVLAKDILALFK
jgi:tRNA(adenine34) deaminase